ncbi:MAG: HU family DNA-binding protein [Phycisphaerales bacterium]|jgi:nucleoid DNA-binding protein|nr:HU family DNA-binding protein [Phycisphaerales bacterium]
MAARKATKSGGKKTTKRTAGRASAKPTASTKRPAKISAASKARTKGDVFKTIADHVGITRKDVAGVFDALGQIISADLGKSGPGVVNVGGLMKVTVQRKPATKARKGINPFTGEQTTFKAKPARNVVKVRPLKSLKSMV